MFRDIFGSPTLLKMKKKNRTSCNVAVMAVRDKNTKIM